jgi:predicted alpha/beta hydrolase family esterase
MKNVIILHGKQDRGEYYDASIPSPSNDHWLPWIQKQLLIRDIHAHTPEVPNSWLPEYEKWKKEFERYDVSDETVLVGHSCGGGFLVRWLSENKGAEPAKVILVAPWLDIEGNIPAAITEGNLSAETDMFQFAIDPDVLARTKLVIYSSDNDMKEIDSTLVKLKKELPGARYVDFKGYGHFCKKDLKSVEFPELLKEILA